MSAAWVLPQNVNESVSIEISPQYRCKGYVHHFFDYAHDKTCDHSSSDDLDHNHGYDHDYARVAGFLRGLALKVPHVSDHENDHESESARPRNNQ